MKVKSESEVAQSCPTLRDPMDCSPPGSSIHGIFQARVLEWAAISNPALALQSCSVLMCRFSQFSSVTQSCPTLRDPMNRSTPGLPVSITNSQSLPKRMSIELVMPSSDLILCRPLLLLSPISPSIRVFSNGSVLCIRWPKYWRFSFSISPSNEHPGLISFRMDWLDLLAVQGTLKSLL